MITACRLATSVGSRAAGREHAAIGSRRLLQSVQSAEPPGVMTPARELFGGFSGVSGNSRSGENPRKQGVSRVLSEPSEGTGPRTWHGGWTPRTERDGLTVRDLVNKFLTTKQSMVDADELTARTFRDYHTSCTRIIAVLGKDRLVDDLAADDFERLRATLAKTMGSEARKVEIQRAKTVFKYAYDAALIDRPVRYGPGFKAPTKRVLQKAKRQNGSRMGRSSPSEDRDGATLPAVARNGGGPTQIHRDLPKAERPGQ